VVSTRSPLVNVMVRAALRVARKLVRDFNEVEHLQVSKKGPSDFVTTADVTADRMLREELSTARPEFGFLTEEGETEVGRDRDSRWIVDPLDGTLNYLHGLPHFSISIAAEIKKKVTAAVIYDPIRNELFWSDLGRGAYLDDRRLRVSARRELSDSLIGTGGPLHDESVRAEMMPALPRLIETVAGYRRSGSAALDLAYVAAGRFDGYWAIGLSPWDSAAGLLLVREAGAIATDLQGRTARVDGRVLLVANDHLHRPLMRLLKPAGKTQA